MNTTITLKEVKKRPTLMSLFGIKLRSIWTDDKLEIEAKKYQTRSAFYKNSGSAYNAALNRGKPFFNKICVHMNKPFRWTDITLEAEAKKYKTKSEFRKGSTGAYSVAYNNRGKSFLDKICAHMDRLQRKKWSIIELEDEAKKYQTRKAFDRGSAGAYQAAHNQGKQFMNKICAHMSNRTWTDDGLETETKKYKTRGAFQKGSRGAYTAARKRGKEFFDKICAHMHRLK